MEFWNVAKMVQKDEVFFNTDHLSDINPPADRFFAYYSIIPLIDAGLPCS